MFSTVVYAFWMCGLPRECTKSLKWITKWKGEIIAHILSRCAADKSPLSFFWALLSVFLCILCAQSLQKYYLILWELFENSNSTVSSNSSGWWWWSTCPCCCSMRFAHCYRGPEQSMCPHFWRRDTFVCNFIVTLTLVLSAWNWRTSSARSLHSVLPCPYEKRFLCVLDLFSTDN